MSSPNDYPKCPETAGLVGLIDGLILGLLRNEPCTSNTYIICPICGVKMTFRAYNSVCPKCTAVLSISGNYDTLEIKPKKTFFRNLMYNLNIICRYYARMRDDEYRITTGLSKISAKIIRKNINRRFRDRLNKFADRVISVTHKTKHKKIRAYIDSFIQSTLCQKVRYVDDSACL